MGRPAAAAGLFADRVDPVGVRAAEGGAVVGGGRRRGLGGSGGMPQQKPACGEPQYPERLDGEVGFPGRVGETAFVARSCGRTKPPGTRTRSCSSRSPARPGRCGRGSGRGRRTVPARGRRCGRPAAGARHRPVPRRLRSDVHRVSEAALSAEPVVTALRHGVLDAAQRHLLGGRLAPFSRNSAVVAPWPGAAGAPEP